MKITPHTADVEAPSYGHGAPQKKMHDEFEDDVVESSHRRKRQAKSRLASLILGLLTLLAAALGAYFFLAKDGIDLQKGASQHANFQGTVSMATIQMHAVPQDCWLAIHGSVYDLTEYAPLHPGPSTLITDHCGTDATAAYNAIHSRALLPTVNEYLLGTLEGEGGSPGGSAPPPTTGGTPGSSGPQISLATMEMHSVPGDCWLAYYGTVYDMTKYAPTHPASSTSITRHCGTDATAAYGAVHPRSYLPMVEEYVLGTLEGSSPGGSAPPPTTGGNPGSSGPQIALATMAAHSTPGDCWVAYYGNVYDMTQYAPTHPGPSTLITRHCGKDGTAAYAGSHGRGLLASVSQYLKGALEGADPSQFPPDNGMGGDSPDSED